MKSGIGAVQERGVQFCRDLISQPSGTSRTQHPGGNGHARTSPPGPDPAHAGATPERPRSDPRVTPERPRVMCVEERFSAARLDQRVSGFKLF